MKYDIQKSRTARIPSVVAGFLFLLMLTPFMLQAHQPGTGPAPLTPIVPQCSGASAGLPAKACTLCDFFHLLQHVINFLTFEAAPLLVMITVIVGGFMFLIAGGSQDRIKTGKNMMFKGVVGYAIVLTSWLIIAQILQSFTSQNFTRPWEISC